MENLFTLLFIISFSCVPVFLLWALINLAKKNPAKRRFKWAGISALIMIVSFVGIGVTMEEDEEPQQSYNTPSMQTALSTSTPSPTITPEPAPAATPTPSPTITPTIIPSSNPAATSESENSQTDVAQNTESDYNFDTYNNAEQQNTENNFVLNTSTLKIHIPSCRSVPKISPENYATSNESLDTLREQGYTTCGICFK